MHVRDVILQDFWVHVAGLIAIGLGAASWIMRTHFNSDPSSLELMFILGGFGTMGVKLINGSAAQLRQAALDTAFSAARVAQSAAAAAQVATAPAAAIPPAPAPAQGGPTSG
jgi:hypothetical protein